MPSLAKLSLALAASALAVQQRSMEFPPVSNPFADPKHDPNNPLRYIASNTLTAIAFSLVLLVAFTQSFFAWRYGARWMLCMVIGEYCFAVGIACRFGLHKTPDATGLYIAEYLFVVLSPCAFIAADYVLLGRLARTLGCDQHLLVRPSRITRAFVASDITTFLIQAAGGGISVGAKTVAGNRMGSHVFLVGLALQLASFFTFTCMYLVFLWRVRMRSPEVWARDAQGPRLRDWRVLGGALSLSCVGILIRSVYRTIELSQGFEGPLATREAFFYGLDTLPLFLAVAVYVPFWPARYVREGAQGGAISSEKPLGLESGATEVGSVEEGKMLTPQL